MKTTKNNIDRGAILHAVAKRSIKTITQIAADAGYEKTSFYVHIRKADLSLDIIYKYGVAMPHDFSIEIPEMVDYLSVHGLKKADDTKLSYEQLLKEKEFWKDRFYTLLEEQNKVLSNKQ